MTFLSLKKIVTTSAFVRLGRNYFYPRLRFQRFTLFFLHASQETKFTVTAIVHEQ